jgi:hypothetical protein
MAPPCDAAKALNDKVANVAATKTDTNLLMIELQ